MKKLNIILAIFVTQILCVSSDTIVEPEEGFLKHNETCSWRNERLRLIAFKDRLTRVNRNAIDDFGNRVIRDNITLCSTRDGFICDKGTRRCRCSNPFRELYPRNGISQPEYVLKMGDDGQQHCYWALGSYCFPEGGIEKNVSCEPGTKCFGVEDWDICTDGTLHSYYDRRYSVTKFYRDIFRGRVCKCE